MTWRWCLSQPLHAISIMISPNWMMGKLKPESPIFNGKNHCFRLTDPMMFNRASSGHVFLHHRTIFGHKHPGGSWDLRIILLQKKSWTIHLTHSIWNMQRENSLYIYMYIHVLNRKKQRLFYSWFWLMLLVSPTKIHVPCHGEKFWDADRPRSGRLSGFGNHQDLSTCRAADCPCVARGSRLAARAWNGDPWGSHDGGSLE